MGFRNPARTAEPTSLNTGGAAPVVISGTAGMMGGAAVLLYPNTTDDPARLEAFTDTEGPGVSLRSPPNTPASGGMSSGISFVGTESAMFPGAHGIYAWSTGPIALQPATGQAVDVGGPLRNTFSVVSAVPGAYAAGWTRYSTAFGSGTSWQDATLYALPDGTIALIGLGQYIGGAGASTLIYTLPAEWRPKTLDGKAFISSGFVSNDTPRAIAIYPNGQIILRGALPGVNTYFSFSAAWPGPNYRHF